MLIKNYKPTKHKIVNNEAILMKPLSSEQYNSKFRNLTYPTTAIDTHFQNLDAKTLTLLIEQQQKAIKEEADIFLKYWFLNESTYEKTIEQYNTLFFYKDNFYPINTLRDYTLRDNMKDETYLKSPLLSNPLPPPTTPKPKPKPTPLKQTLSNYKISRKAIRNITEYTHEPIPKWSNKAPYNTPEYQKKTPILWQYNLLEDQADTIIVNGSRQIWKSHTIAEKAIEESFIPDNDILVWAFMVKTTNVIRNYILKFLKKFNEDDFTHFKSEWYIINNVTWTKIHFRTLSDWAENVLGLTLYLIIIDEAQLVDDEVFDDALLPTLTTTWWRMIMIWTPWKKQKWYFFKKMIEAKKQIETNTSNPYETISLYEVTIDDNPLVHPKTRERIMAKIKEPAIQRQYFCSWSSGWDNLFNPKIVDNINWLLNKNWYLVLGIDPARLQDRSGYAVNFVYNNKVTLISSWEVPKQFKKQWQTQVIFYKTLKEKILSIIDDPSKLVTVMDVSWVWDAVAEIFEKNWFPISVKIRYTSWDTPNKKWIYWKIPKSTLINTKLDFISEEFYQVFSAANKDYLEELEYIYEDELRNWNMAMTSTFFDDITNAELISIYAIKERNLLSRSLAEDTDNITVVGNKTEARFANVEKWEDEVIRYAKHMKKKKQNNSVW